MRAVIQRVQSASVTVAGKRLCSIDRGLVVLLGITHDDDTNDASWLAKKILQLRIFNDRDGVMNRDIRESGGAVIVVSQFTLHAKTKKGNRPSYVRAAAPEQAIPLYESFIRLLDGGFEGRVAQGQFGADMQVALVNDGPVTIIIDTKNKE